MDVWCQETELFYNSSFSQKAVNIKDLYEMLVYRIYLKSWALAESTAKTPPQNT